MYIQDQVSYDAFPELDVWVRETVKVERGSRMRQESAAKIAAYQSENAVTDELNYHAGLKPLVIKKSGTTGKEVPRTFAQEVIRQANTVDEADGLDYKENDMFTKNVLPIRPETKPGLTNPQPDWAYGLKLPQFPDPTAPLLSQKAKSLIKVSPQLRHTFFVIENKGCEHSLEEAENQAIRSGATLVAARRRLNEMAGLTDSKNVGVDFSSIAFSCAWGTQMASNFVHWCETRKDSPAIYHMNRIKSYLTGEAENIADFRAHVNNILDFGISPQRKQKLQELEKMIAEKEKGK